MKHGLFIFILLVTVSCAIPHYPKKYEKLGIYNRDSIKEIAINPLGTNQINIQYLGCGNIYIKHHNDAILFDPFFSNTPGYKVAFGKIKFNQKYFDKGSYYLNRFGNNYQSINGIFISHAHYDHLLDLPYLLENKLIDNSTKIYGSGSVKTILNNFIKSNPFINQDSLVFIPKTKPNWIYISNEMRVLVIPASHAPHIANIHFMHGQCDSNYFKNYTSTNQKVKAGQFKDGSTFAYLVDILNNDSITLRLLLKGAGCNVNNGKIFEELLAEKAVDIALLQVASANFTDCYPQNLVNQIKPKKVILTHWEDFFKPYAPKKIKTVRATNFNYFYKKIKASEEANFELNNKYIMPNIGNMLIYRY
ncbi:MAG: MBL fold metallo-hydrolase [Candidatus Methylacidiphilales bacterium]